MKEFEVRYKRDANAKEKSFRVKAPTEEIARKQSMRMLQMTGAKSPEIISVRELTTTK